MNKQLIKSGFEIYVPVSDFLLCFNPEACNLITAAHSFRPSMAQIKYNFEELAKDPESATYFPNHKMPKFEDIRISNIYLEDYDGPENAPLNPRANLIYYANFTYIA